jgi:site-specific DNA recombinase
MPTRTPDILTKSPIEILAELTAVIYLRVSSTGQLTGHSQEGYSIEGQREACERHAQRLGARIVAEYVEPGKSATNLRRPKLQKMLADLPDLRPDYVIFYDLSRVARDEFDAFWILREINAAGAKLESTLERIGNDDDGMLLYTVMAGVNAHRSRRDGKKAKMGMERKHADGGTNGRTRIGYLNSREYIGGREVRVVDIDPERAPLVQMGFELFATGNYSISELHTVLEEAGLLKRETRTRGPLPLSRSQVHRMLRDDYYIGVVKWGGTTNPNGRHTPLIDVTTFEKVQQVLDTARLSGNRTRKHKHYLRGSLFCGFCGRRLVFHRIRGRGGLYDYFGCLSHQGTKGSCGSRYLQVENVERAVERYYARVRLTQDERDAVRQAVEQYAGALLENAEKESARHARRLQALQQQQKKLLHAFYNNAVDETVLEEEQERIETERREVHRWSEAAVQDAGEITQALYEALLLLETAQVAYRHATPTARRLLNQALFEGLLIRDEDDLEANPTPWVSEIRRLARAAQGCQTALEAQGRGQNGHDPLSGAVGFHKANLVRRAGLEPAPPD